MSRHGVRREAWLMILLVGGGWFLEGDLSKAASAEKEIRVFNVKVDNKPAGYYKMTISCPDDHMFTVDSDAHVSVSRLFIKVYAYTYQGTEVWKDSRLVYLKSTTNDDGTPFNVLAQAEGENLRIRVNGEERISTRPDVRTTTYWRLPELQSPNQAVAFLDCDTGKDLYGSMRYVGVERLTVAGQAQNCGHYQILGRGGLHVDVWYDARKRLFRQDSLDDGHHVVLELTRIDR